jgi:hypothetical protein
MLSIAYVPVGMFDFENITAHLDFSPSIALRLQV